ncbi:MAG TPA: ion channel, partial [Thermoanaerobaculia bacterium]|nr:ion channel [Thermoanaerobaculia bacterium]
VFSARHDAVVRARGRTAVTVEERVYFTGATLFTFGNSELVPNGRRWRFATVLTGAMGLGTATLAVTYLMQVLSSVVLKRTVGALISDTGGTPAAIIGRSWTGETFDGLDLFMSQLTTMLHEITEQHLAYPVLHYYHSEQLRTATSVRIASLHELILILCNGVAPEARPSLMTLHPVRDALAGFGRVLEREFVEAAQGPPPPPPLAPIRELGVPTVEDAEFFARVAESDKVRRLLLGLVDGDGWAWEDVNRQ